MFNGTKIYTVESVTSGHPDKVCDQISDAILDECLRNDPKSRVAVENFGGHGLLVIGGVPTKSKNKRDNISNFPNSMILHNIIPIKNHLSISLIKS